MRERETLQIGVDKKRRLMYRELFEDVFTFLMLYLDCVRVIVSRAQIMPSRREREAMMLTLLAKVG